ncbi:storkhead-box protein 1 [Paroedura picta]|uniref:storkhead-box protein 1 n=1 Tax=Paroedura picta TaxID=143630 RepID=UPI004056E8BA
MPPPPPPPPPPAMQRAVQLAPSSLAVVLRRRAGAGAGAGAGAEASGAAVFEAFRRANAACFWNAGLAGAVGRVWLQGWLRGGVLLLQGPAGPLQLLRDAWLRRALRPPHGFIISAVGDVSPVHMNPILQSQFVPLAEVLCCVISDMNGAHTAVTQETLLDQLGKHFPGIATPTQDIIYNTLGMLIKERKIYHTGEGYFIVTPNTYFISNNAVKNNKKVLLEAVGPQEPSITYLVSMEDSPDFEKEDFPLASHCRSCHCFVDHTVGSEPQQLSNHDLNGKAQKGSCGSRFSGPNPATDLLPVRRSCETARSSHSAKEKEKGKKFGLSLFWRNTLKKEKPQKAFSSFSAQFPPEEWPVRDEDSLDNIPRDVEHEIIKRINPVLTVDNLMKHTALMRKIEEEKKYISKGTSTEVLTAKHRHLPKSCRRKKHSRAVKHRRKLQPGKEKQVNPPPRSSQADDLLPASSKRGNSAEHPSSCLTNGSLLCEKPACETATEADACFVYKKEIPNPFQGILCRGNKSTKGRRSHKNNCGKHGIPRSERKFLWSCSLDSSETVDWKTKQLLAIKCDDNCNQKEHRTLDCSNRRHVPDCCTEHSSCSQCHGQRGSLGESIAYKQDMHRGASPRNMLENQAASETYTALLDESEMEYPPASSHPHQYGLKSQNLGHLKSICFPSSTEAAHLSTLPEDDATQRHHGALKTEPQSSKASKWLETVHPHCERCSHDKPTLSPKGDAADACGLPGQDGKEEASELPSSQPPCSSSSTGRQNNIERKQDTDMCGSGSASSHLSGHGADTDQVDSWGHEGNGLFSIPGPNSNSKEYLKVNVIGESCACHQIPPCAYKSGKETVGLGGHRQALAAVSTCVFNCCDLRETEAGLWQESVNEVDRRLASLAPPSAGREVKTSLVEKPQAFGDVVSAADQCPQHEQNHLEGIGSHSITGDSGIDSPRTQSLASANSAILEGLKKRRSFLMNLEGIEKTIQSGRALTRNSLLQLTPVMNV